MRVIDRIYGLTQECHFTCLAKIEEEKRVNNNVKGFKIIWRNWSVKKSPVKFGIKVKTIDYVETWTWDNKETV